MTECEILRGLPSGGPLYRAVRRPGIEVYLIWRVWFNFGQPEGFGPLWDPSEAM